MTKTLMAVYDGKYLKLDNPFDLEPNSRVQITIESSVPLEEKKISFLTTALSLNLDGPSDWSAKFEDYLYEKGNGKTD